MTQIMKPVNHNIHQYTPAWIGEGLACNFDLDPCGPAGNYPMRSWIRKTYALERGEDGLTLPWTAPSSSRSFVWLNPPWTRGVKGRWLTKLAKHKYGIALARGTLDTGWLHDNVPDAIFALRGKVRYVTPEGGEAKSTAVQPSMLLAYGFRAKDILANCELDGFYMEVA